MAKLFATDSPVISFLSKLCDLLLLDLMWLAGCIPVITAGTSTAALYRCVRNLDRDGSVRVFSEFWGAFREEWKQATALWVVVLLAAGIFGADLYIVFFSGLDAGLWGYILMAVLALLLLPAMCIVFPMQACYENKVVQTLKNAWLFAMMYLPVSITVAVCNLLPVLLLLLWPAAFWYTALLWLLLGGSGIAYVSYKLLKKRLLSLAG